MARKKTSGVHTVKTTNTAAQKIEAAKAVVEKAVEEKAAEVKEAVKETAEKVEEAAKETVEKATEKATETVAEVKEIMDEAISHSQKANVKHLARRVFGKGTDDSDRIILKEEDFRI